MFKAVKPVVQVALLIVGIAMVCFGVMRGEADAVLAKRLGCAWSVSELDKRENTASHVLARFRGFIQAAVSSPTFTCQTLPKAASIRAREKQSAYLDLIAIRAPRHRVRAPSGRSSPC